MKTKLETAAFAAGCFWGVEESFRRLPGVAETAVGYMGGKKSNPVYKEVSTGNTGHAETVRVVFDPAQISYNDLLNHFWQIHDPTQLNRQGPDVGSQYRSVIFFYTLEQFALAGRSLEAISKSGRFSKPIATEIVPAEDFWRAEEYHQRYLEKTGRKVC